MPDTKTDDKTSTTSSTPSGTTSSGNVQVKTLQVFDEQDVALVQDTESGAFRLMTYDEQQPHFPRKSLVLPLSFEMKRADFGKLLEPDNVAKKLGLPLALQDAVNKALYRNGVFRLDKDSSIPEQAISAAAKAAYKYVSDELNNL